MYKNQNEIDQETYELLIKEAKESLKCFDYGSLNRKIASYLTGKDVRITGIYDRIWNSVNGEYNSSIGTYYERRALALSKVAQKYKDTVHPIGFIVEDSYQLGLQGYLPEEVYNSCALKSKAMYERHNKENNFEMSEMWSILSEFFDKIRTYLESHPELTLEENVKKQEIIKKGEKEEDNLIFVSKQPDFLFKFNEGKYCLFEVKRNKENSQKENAEGGIQRLLFAWCLLVMNKMLEYRENKNKLGEIGLYDLPITFVDVTTYGFLFLRSEYNIGIDVNTELNDSHTVCVKDDVKYYPPSILPNNGNVGELSIGIVPNDVFITQYLHLAYDLDDNGNQIKPERYDRKELKSMKVITKSPAVHTNGVFGVDNYIDRLRTTRRVQAEEDIKNLLAMRGISLEKDGIS